MRLAPALLAAALLVPACTRGDADTSSRPEIVTAVYPLTWLARQVGGPHVSVVDAAPPGAEPHDVELTPAQVGQIERADLVLLIGGFQPALDDAAPEERTLDALAVAGGDDPHVWLDPEVMTSLARRLAEELGKIDPDHAPDYLTNAAAVIGTTRELHDHAALRLKDCKRKDLVTGHAAFGRFAARYGLRETGIAGVDAETEPSPGRIAEVVSFVRRNGVTTVFGESREAGPARTVAVEAGVRLAVLDPAEVFTGDDYVTVMRRNVSEIGKALGC